MEVRPAAAFSVRGVLAACRTEELTMVRRWFDPGCPSEDDHDVCSANTLSCTTPRLSGTAGTIGPTGIKEPSRIVREQNLQAINNCPPSPLQPLC